MKQKFYIQKILEDIDNIQESKDQYEIDFLKQRIATAVEAVAGLDIEYDKGPWEVNGTEEGIYLYSDEFKHDVSLKVNGDFYNLDSKLTYAKKLADQLNQSTNKQENKNLPFKTDLHLYIQDFDSKLSDAKKLADQLNQSTNKQENKNLLLETNLNLDIQEFDKKLLDDIVDQYTRNRNVTWELKYSNTNGIGTAVELLFSDGKTFNVTNYDIW